MSGILKRLKRLAMARTGAAGVLGINERNLHYIYRHNKRVDFPLADDKLKTKEVLVGIGVPVPETYRVYSGFFELAGLKDDLSALDGFVVKPACGHGGGGISVITGRSGAGFVDAGARVHTIEDIKRLISDIIFGVYSFDLHDRAIVEGLVVQHPFMEALSPAGLADVRVVICEDRPVMAMTRIPTSFSGGRANLHQGAVGVGVDLETGRTVHAIDSAGDITAHPDTGAQLIGLSLPDWKEVIKISTNVARAMPLKYLGVDIGLARGGPVVLEVNVRPGLQIQNANMAGLRRALTAMEETVGR